MSSLLAMKLSAWLNEEMAVMGITRATSIDPAEEEGLADVLHDAYKLRNKSLKRMRNSSRQPQESETEKEDTCSETPAATQTQSEEPDSTAGQEHDTAKASAGHQNPHPQAITASTSQAQELKQQHHPQDTCFDRRSSRRERQHKRCQ